MKKNNNCSLEIPNAEVGYSNFNFPRILMGAQYRPVDKRFML